MTDQSIEQEIQAKGLTAPRITPPQIKALMDRISHAYFVQGTSTFCHAFLDGKFLLSTGHSACVSLENFDPAIGRSISFRDAMAQAEKKLWEMEGYALYKRLAEGGSA
jgi:hypothetical protein